MPPAPVRTLVATLVALPLLLLAPPPAAVAGSPRCAVAWSLTQADKPQQAAALVEQVRVATKSRRACDGAAIRARAAIHRARFLARRAASAGTTASVVTSGVRADERAKAWKAVETSARQALAVDQENQLATVLLAQADAAIASIEEEAAPFGGLDADDRSSDWTDLLQGSLADLGRLALLALGLMTAIVLLARLLLLAPQSVGRRSVGPPRLPVAGVVAPVAVAAAAAAVVVLLPDADNQRLWWLAAGVVAATLVSWSWLFHRPRVQVTMQVKGKSDECGAAAVVAHLRSLGARPAAGLEIPRGADVETLKGSNIAAASVTGVLGSLVGVLQSALSVTPWQVLVDRDTDDQTVVVVSLHGRVRETAVIQHAMFGKSGPKVDPLKLAAACVLMTILDVTKRYDGLGGATVWMSIGLQYDATSGVRPQEEMLQMLARAVDLDPASWPAQMSWRVERGRSSSKGDELEMLSDWLCQAAGKVTDRADSTLRARMAYNAYVAYLNCLAAREVDPAPDSIDGQRLEALRWDVDDALKQVPQGAFRSRMTANVEALRARLPATATDLRSEIALTPSRAYIRACQWAGRRDTFDRALVALDFAFSDEKYRAVAKTDPMLEDLRELPAYRNAFPVQPRAALTDIAPFDVHSVALKAAGLTEPAPLGRIPLKRLAAALGADVAVARELQQRALLVLAVDPELEAYRLEIVEVAVAEGITTVADLRSPDVDAVALGSAIMTACRRRGLADPDPADLQAWLDQLAAAPATLEAAPATPEAAPATPA